MYRQLAWLLTLLVAACGLGLVLAQDGRTATPGRDRLVARFDGTAPAVGDPVPDVTLVDAKGEPHRLRDLTREHYTVLVLGCLT